MEAISWSQIILAALAATGGVTGLVAFGTFVIRLWDRRRKARSTEEDKRLNDAVELKKLATQAAHIDDEMVRAGLWQIIGEYKERIEKCEKELKDSEDSHSLSRPRMLKIYEVVRAIRKQANILVLMVSGKDSDMQREVEILMQRLDELEQALP
jgi:hypothetical protein